MNPSRALLPSVLLPLPDTSHPSPVSGGPELLLLRPHTLHPELAGSNVHSEAPEQFSRYRAPPYSRNPVANASNNGDTYESSASLGKAVYLVQRQTRAGSAMEGGLLAGVAGAMRPRYLTALVNVLGLAQQLSLGQDRHISWIQRLEIAEIECI